MLNIFFKYNYSMILIPAIDLKNGKCVRLRQGLINDETIFSDNPLKMAEKWIKKGARRIHLVDLDGAFDGKPANSSIIKDITKTFPNTPIQIGGGIRSIDVANSYIEAGVSYLIIGTMAITNPEFVGELCLKFPGKIIVGLDANNGFVATCGWTKKTNVSVLSIVNKLKEYGVSYIIYTDIARDGMMAGMNIKYTDKLANSTSVPVIASGGLSNMEDIYTLKKYNNPNIAGAITGRAIYEGAIDFVKAQEFLDAN